MNRFRNLLISLLLASFPVRAQEHAIQTVDSTRVNSFNDQADTENWAGSTQTMVESGIESSLFPASPVLKASVVPASPAGTNIRPSLQFSPVTLNEPYQFIRMRLKLRFASGMIADRRLQTCFWNSGMGSGYLYYAKAGSQGTFSGSFREEPAVPPLGPMNTNASGTTLTTTGNRAASLGTSQAVIRDVTLLAFLSAGGSLTLRGTCTNDNGEVLALNAADYDGPLTTFDRFDLTVWGNTVEVEIDEAELTTGKLVPPGVWDGENSAHFNDPLNWESNALPADNANLLFGAAFGFAAHNNLPAGNAFNWLVFTDTANDTYTLSGNPLQLNGGIVSNSFVEQRVQIPLILNSQAEISVTSGPVALAEAVSGTSGITKTGAGNLILSGMNTYTGTTVVKAGTLTLANPSLAGTSSVEIQSGAFLALDFEGTAAVDSLILGGETLPGGTYNASTHPAFLTGNGALTVGSVPAYDSWIASFTTLPPGADKTRSGDPDADGMPNYQEFAFSTDPSSAAGSPAFVRTADGFLTLTVAVRTGLDWSGDGPLVSSMAEGLSYRLEGGTTLQNFTAPVARITPLTEGLPPLREGWEYITVRLARNTRENPRGFLRVSVTDHP